MPKSVSVLAALVLTAGAALAQQPVRSIVEFNGPADAAAVTKAGGSVVKQIYGTNAIVAYLPPAAVSALLASANVASVQEDATVTAGPGASGKKPGGSTPPPSQTINWGVDRIEADLVWATNRGAGVQVHVIDTGIDNAHADLSPRVVLGPNFNNPAKTSKDDNGHGTHVAGIIGASDNTIGVVGVANQCTLTAVKVLAANGSGWVSDVVEGINWSAANGAQVVNLSLGSSSDVAVMQAAVDNASNAGVVVCAAAGNDGNGTNVASYPGAYASVICVGATDQNEARAHFSTYGPQVDVAAPGNQINSTWKGGGYKVASGTSMATPMVAGVAALCIAAGQADVRTAIEATALDLGTAGRDDQFGHGRVDASRAVAYAPPVTE